LTHCLKTLTPSRHHYPHPPPLLPLPPPEGMKGGGEEDGEGKIVIVTGSKEYTCPGTQFHGKLIRVHF